MSRSRTVLLILVLLLVSCGKMQEEPQNNPAGDTKALEALFDSTDMQNYRSWSLFPGTHEYMDGSRGDGPHGRYVTVYANGIAEQAVADDAYEMPDGAIIMKDAFTAEKELRATVLMAKNGQAWQYGVIGIHGVDSVRFDRFGKAGTDAAKSCNECHLDAERDLVFMWK